MNVDLLPDDMKNGFTVYVELWPDGQREIYDDYPFILGRKTTTFRVDVNPIHVERVNPLPTEDD